MSRTDLIAPVSHNEITLSNRTIPFVLLSHEIIKAIANRSFTPIECISRNGAERRIGFHRRRMYRDRLVRGHYVFSGQRHFASTIFADQILIVGWRLSKEAWSPVGSLSATRCTNASVFFFLFLFFLARRPALPSRVFSHGERVRCTSRRSRVALRLGRVQRCPRNAYANRIELPESRNHIDKQVPLPHFPSFSPPHSKCAECLQNGKSYKPVYTSEKFLAQVNRYVYRKLFVRLFMNLPEATKYIFREIYTSKWCRDVGVVIGRR